jgi:hypothetical protein
MAPLDRLGIDCQGNTRPFRELFDNAVLLNRRFINHPPSRSISRQRASFTIELKVSILASDIHQCIKYTMQHTILHCMNRCVEESEKTGDFQLSPLLDRQVCPPVDSKLRKIVSLIRLEFTTMNRWVGRESHLVNTLISVPIAFYA